MANFSGSLNANEFYNGLYNAYKLITTFADGLSGLDRGLASRFKADGGMYKDKSVYTDMDIISSREWDPTDTNVLAPEQKVAPKQQEIVLDQKRQIGLTTDRYLTARAWGDESAFNQFNSVVQAQVGNTEKVYEETLVNVAVGTMETAVGKQKQTVTIAPLGESPTFAETEAHNRVAASLIANKIADLFVAIKKPNRDFNDYGFMKSYDKSSLLIIWNADYINKIEKRDLPTMFHKDGLISFEGEIMPGEYFGTVAAAGNSVAGDLSLGEYYIPVNTNGAYAATGTTVKHVFAGEALPVGTPIVAVTTKETSAKKDFTINGQTLNIRYYTTVHAYKPDSKIICKIMHKDSIKYLSSFKTSTEFFNAKNLSTNRYLTWMYAKPDYLRNYPLITLREVEG